MLDQFYTSDAEVEKCLEAWEAIVKVDGSTIIEPSAGAGAFSNKISGCIAYDLEPKSEGIIQQDFLKLDLKQWGDIHFIGNPPFGRGSNLAFKFIHKMTSYKQTKSFSLVLPVSHTRHHQKNKIDPYFHIMHEHYVNDFVEFGQKKKVSCIFQIWVRKDFKRELYNLFPKTNVITVLPHHSTSKDFDFKIGNKKRPAVVFNKSFTYYEEGRSSFYKIIVHNQLIYDILKSRVGSPLFRVKRQDFVAAANISQFELINCIEELFESTHGPDPSALPMPSFKNKQED